MWEFPRDSGLSKIIVGISPWDGPYLISSNNEFPIVSSSHLGGPLGQPQPVILTITSCSVSLQREDAYI